MEAPTRIRALTYNIHGCRGSDGREDPERILAVLREAQADLIALQEVDRHTRADGDLLRRLERWSDYQMVFAPNFEKPGGTPYGNILLSRYPLEAVRPLDISLPGREPRGAITAIARLPAGPLEVLATHLGLSPRERRWQIHRLLEQRSAAATEADPAVGRVLMGDFNEWLLWGRGLRRLRRYFGAAPSPRSFPARCPLLRLDRIWVRPRAAIRSVHRLGSPLARRASDHLPVLAELGFPAREAPDGAVTP